MIPKVYTLHVEFKSLTPFEFFRKRFQMKASFVINMPKRDKKILNVYVNIKYSALEFSKL